MSVTSDKTSGDHPRGNFLCEVWMLADGGYPDQVRCHEVRVESGALVFYDRLGVPFYAISASAWGTVEMVP